MWNYTVYFSEVIHLLVPKQAVPSELRTIDFVGSKTWDQSRSKCIDYLSSKQPIHRFQILLYYRQIYKLGTSFNTFHLPY